MKHALDLLKQAAWDWFDDQATTLGAAVAYYTVFSIAPLFITISIAGFVFGREAAQGQIFEQLRALIGETSAAAVQDVVESATSKPATGVVATILGFVALIIGASGVFAQMQASLNAIWRVQPKPGRGVFWGLVRDRILSFGFILIVGFLLLISLILSAIIAFIGEWFGGFVPGVEMLIQILNAIISLAVITLLFAMIFKFLPDIEIAWRDVWIGALITAALFTVGKEILGLYLGKSGVASSYGAAGSLIVLLLWVYYSAQIVFFGAEFTKAYAKKFGSHVTPTENAMPVSKSPLS
jgi:membrane protein